MLAVNKSSFDEIIKVYDLSMKKLIDNVSLTCKEQGSILSFIWGKYNSTVKQHIINLTNNMKTKEIELAKLSNNLITKFEKSFKEHTEILNELKEKTQKQKNKINDLKRTVKEYEFRELKLLENITELKEDNKKLEDQIIDILERYDALKIILSKDLNPDEVRFKLMSQKLNHKYGSLQLFLELANQTQRDGDIPLDKSKEENSIIVILFNIIEK